MVNLKIFKTYGMLKIWQHTIIFILLILSKVNSGNCFDVNFDNRLSIKPRGKIFIILNDLFSN